MDASWLTASSATAATDARFGFDTPANSLQTGAGLQKIYALLRKTAGAPNPPIDLALWEGGGAISTLLTGTAITSTLGQIVEASFDASLLADVSGADVEVRIVSTVGTTLGALAAYSAVGTAFSGTAAGAQAIDYPVCTTGNLLIMVAHARSSNSNGTISFDGVSGWTQLGGAGNTYGTGISKMAIGWKIAVDGESTSTTVSVTFGGTGTVRFQARIFCFTAANGFASPPIADVTAATVGTAGAGATLPMPTVAPGGLNRLAIAAIAQSTSTNTASAGVVTNGTWAQVVAESAATNGTIELQSADQSNGTTISGGTITSTNGNSYVTLGFTIVPATTNVNTVEIGAVEWVAITETPTGDVSLGTIQSPAVVGSTLTETKTVSGLTVDEGANSVLAIIQFCIPYNYTEDYATTSVKFNGAEMTKKYWSRSTVSGSGIYQYCYTLFAYLDSPAASGDLVIDWPITNLNYSVAVTWIPIFGAAAGDAKFGAVARAEGASATKTTLLQITPTQVGSWLFAAISRRDNTDGAITWTDSTLNAGEIREWTGAGAGQAGCGACAYRTSASLSAHDVGGAAAVDGADTDYRGTVACIELLSSGTALGLAAVGAATSEATGVLKVVKGLAGLGAATSGATVDLNTRRALAGTGAAVSAATGQHLVRRRLVGTGAAASTATGALKASRPLVGAGAADSTATGALKVSRPLAGTGAATSTATGALTVIKGLASTGTVASTMTGALLVGRKLAGTLVLESDASAAILVTAGLDTIANAEATATGALTVDRPLAATAAAASTLAGAILPRRALAGVAASESATTADLLVSRALTGVAVAASTMVGDLLVARALTGVLEAESGAVVEIQVAGQRDLDGVASADSAASAEILITRALAGTGVAESGAAGTILVRRSLVGEAVAESAATGALTIDTHAMVALEGVSAVTSAATGVLAIARDLAGVAAGISGSLVSLSVSAGMEGIAAGASTASASLQVTRRLAGAADALSTASSILALGFELAGLAASASTLTGILAVQRALLGTAAATSTLAGGLKIPTRPGALPAYNSVGTVLTAATPPGTYSVNVPAHNPGDLLILPVSYSNGGTNATLASINTAGWQQVGGPGFMFGGAQHTRMGLGWKIGDGVETSVSITVTGSSATPRRLQAVVIRATAANGFAPVPIANVAALSGVGTSVQMPTVAPNDLYQLALCAIGIGVSTLTPSATGEVGGDWASLAAFRGTDGTLDLQTSDQSGGGTVSGGSLAITSGAWVALGFTVVPFDLGTVALAGAVAAESAASAMLQQARRLVGAAAAVSGASGALTVGRALAGAAAGISAAVGDVSASPAVTMEGVAAGTSGASGALRIFRRLEAQATVASAAIVQLRARRGLRVVASSSAAGSASLAVERALVGGAAAESGMVGTTFLVPTLYMTGVAVFDVEVIDGTKYGVAVAGPVTGVGVFGRAA